MLHLFPLWAIVLSAFALWQSDIFVQARGAITPLLGIIMFGMGMTLSWRNFRETWTRPWPVLIGIALQFGIMPAAAWLISMTMQLQTELFIGMLLVGTCSGGTASNVICYLARGDVALSITLTTASTLLGIFMTPWLTLVYAGQAIDVPALSMLITICKIILLPVTLGVVVNALLGGHLHRFKTLFPGISAAAIILIIAIIAALNKTNLAQVGLLLSLAVILHNTIGLAAGYGVAHLLGQDKTVARTIAIEVGMQNSGLAVALALKYFSGINGSAGSVVLDLAQCQRLDAGGVLEQREMTGPGFRDSSSASRRGRLLWKYRIDLLRRGITGNARGPANRPAAEKQCWWSYSGRRAARSHRCIGMLADNVHAPGCADNTVRCLVKGRCEFGFQVA